MASSPDPPRPESSSLACRGARSVSQSRIVQVVPHLLERKPLNQNNTAVKRVVFGSLDPNVTGSNSRADNVVVLAANKACHDGFGHRLTLPSSGMSDFSSKKITASH